MWHSDNGQVVELMAQKVYGNPPGVHISLEEIPDEEKPPLHDDIDLAKREMERRGAR